MGSRAAGKVGEYRIVRHWASGGTSQIYLAKRDDAPALVALKTLRADRAHDKEHVEWFAREIGVAKRIDHEHLLRSLESFEHDGVPYLAMEFLAGETLHDILRTIHPERRMPAAVALELTHRLARAVHHLHQLGAIHGDVCPANILIAYDGRVKLIDLGGRCQGCTMYAAPEQARGEAFDARADVFSLGLILFEMLTGHSVRQGRSEKEIAAAAASGSVPSLSEMVETDPELESLVMTALEMNRRNRFPDAASFADALQSYRESAVPNLVLESKLSDFMEQNFAGRARSLDARVAGDRSKLAGDRVIAGTPPLGHMDPGASIEAALRTHNALASNPFAEPITGDIGWSHERTSPNDLAPALARPSWLLVLGSMMLVIAAIVGALLLS